MTKFVDYLAFPDTTNLHPELALMYPSIKESIHLIIYGPSGVGKYTVMLQIMKHYSHSQLKNEKKIIVDTVCIKFSDIHYEVDMELLGCNSKTLWNDVYQQIFDIIQSKPEKHGFIVCKNMHKINKELLEVLYSYMQTECIRFIFITEAVSFLPPPILSKCKIIPVRRPVQSHTVKLNAGDLNLEMSLITKIIDSVKTSTFTPSELRDDLYNILIFDAGIDKLVFHVLCIPMTIPQRIRAIQETLHLYKYYSNNYRPIFHLERFIYSMLIIIHKLN
jgi:Cdc6-like AAA superfamily ATPase